MTKTIFTITILYSFIISSCMVVRKTAEKSENPGNSGNPGNPGNPSTCQNSNDCPPGQKCVNSNCIEESKITDLCPDDPNKTVPGKCGCGRSEDSCDDPAEILPHDTVLLPPKINGPIIAPIVAYNWRDYKTWSPNSYELPIYKDLDRETDQFWNYIIDELLLSRIHVAMFHARGCWNLKAGQSDSMKGSGDHCPRLLTKLVDAIDRAGARQILKLGMWDDTGSYPSAKGYAQGDPKSRPKLDMSNKNDWKFFWDHNMKIWFDTIPKDLWFMLDGGPVIAFWTLSNSFITNGQNNLSKLLTWLSDNFFERYKVRPRFIIQQSWIDRDSSITTKEAYGKHGWFSPKHDLIDSIYSYMNFNGAKWGAIAPSYRKVESQKDGEQPGPGCGTECREVTRRDGQTLENALSKGTNAKFILLEAWNNMAENAAFYRSNNKNWKYPTQYINMVRHYADPAPETLRFQAEGADDFLDKTTGNTGNKYRNGDLDIGELDDNMGWYVGWIQSNEWIEYKEVELASGTYRFTARVASNQTGGKIRLDLPSLTSVEVPNTGGLKKYKLIHLGEAKLNKGTHNLRLIFETGNFNIDWFFLKKADY